MFWRLEGHEPIELDMQQYVEWIKATAEGDGYEKANRVDSTYVNGVHISTMFLGVGYSLNGGLPPMFETMIFGWSGGFYQKRCYTWEEAVEQHAEAVKTVNELNTLDITPND